MFTKNSLQWQNLSHLYKDVPLHKIMFRMQDCDMLLIQIVHWRRCWGKETLM